MYFILQLNVFFVFLPLLYHFPILISLPDRLFRLFHQFSDISRRFLFRQTDGHLRRLQRDIEIRSFFGQQYCQFRLSVLLSDTGAVQLQRKV